MTTTANPAASQVSLPTPQAVAPAGQLQGEAPRAEPICTCPSGDGSLRWPCLAHLPAAPVAEPSQAALDVLAERRRQVEAEGWTPEHDDGYVLGELARAAAAYALNTATEDGPYYWPWPRAWWKPVNARRDLVKSGALILAEIERLDRAVMQEGAQHDGRN